MKSKNKIRSITTASLIAACYVVLTYLTSLFGLASGPVQLRLSEAMCILPAFTFSAVPGLFAGCLLSNILTGCIPLDVVFGSLATLIGAYGTFFLAKNKLNPFTYPVPAIAANTVIIPFILKFAYGFVGGLWYFFVTVGIGEILSCGVLGTILYYSLNKRQIFK